MHAQLSFRTVLCLRIAPIYMLDLDVRIIRFFADARQHRLRHGCSESAHVHY